jgi:ribosomal protein S18 acetylase RimI-like enzyme
MVEIRAARPDDLESFHTCLDAVARERRWLAMVEAPPLEQVRAVLAQTGESAAIRFVAVEGARVVGWCDVFPNPREGFRHGGTLGMGLRDGYRARGLGAALLRAALEAARARGLARIALEVYDTNVRAITLYRRFGFEQEGVKRAARILDGRMEDIVCMALWLRDPGTIAARPLS